MTNQNPTKRASMPVLLLREHENGQVTGVCMTAENGFYSMSRFAARYVTLDEVEQAFLYLTGLDAGSSFDTLVKHSNILSNSVETACASTPESEQGQKEVLCYRNFEWTVGIWNNPTKPHALTLALHSVADFHGGRVTEQKRERRATHETALANKTLMGDYSILEQSFGLLGPDDAKCKTGEFEQLPAIKFLCDWWNANAPQAMRFAQTFRIYVWDEDNRIFNACDPEEPAMGAQVMASFPCYAVFEREGSPPVFVTFSRGRAFNKQLGDRGTQTFFANGDEDMDVGCDLEQVDEAYYAFKGLRTLSKRLCAETCADLYETQN